MKLVQFGAGNIGRSFIGQLFGRAGYEVVFVDIDRRVIDALDQLRRYRVVVKRNEAADETIWVENVRGVDAADLPAVRKEVATADLVATSVGKKALPHIFSPIAEGLVERRRIEPDRPLDIIIAENIRAGAELFRRGLLPLLPEDYPLEAQVGLVETSIGKMVPIMTEEDRARDPLWVFAEGYNTLIVDRRGFRGKIPEVPDLDPVENIVAYVDRKLFVHNLGHAASAYFGYVQNPDFTYLWEPLTDRSLVERVTAAMRQAAAALNREYPDDLPAQLLEEHIQDLLRRFANRALGDTLFRVGRDLYRKLGRDDRLIGACLLAARHGLPFDAIAEAVRAAVQFRARDEHGLMFPDDRRFAGQEVPKGLGHILESVCGLSTAEEIDRRVVERLLASR